MNKKTYIGISGVARSGKNLFCDISKKIITEKYGLSCSSYALAYYLKHDCQDFIKDKLGLDVFTENTEDKKVFRDMLVWYGDVKRKQTQGRYWTEKLQTDIEKDNADVIFITDIRYNFYPNDEVYWIHKELNGKLIHVSKYTYGFPKDGRRIRSDIASTTKKIWTEPSNEHERWNDPRVKVESDFIVEWEHIKSDGKTYQDIIEDENLNKIVYPIYEKMFKK